MTEYQLPLTFELCLKVQFNSISESPGISV